MGFVLKCNRYRLVDNRSFELPLPMKFVLFKEDNPVAEYDISADERVSCRILTKYKELMLTPISRPLTISDIYFFLSSRVFQENTPFAANALSLVGLEKYSVLGIAKITRGITPYDEYWLKFDGDTFNYEQALDNFNKIFSSASTAFVPAQPPARAHNGGKNNGLAAVKAEDILNQHRVDVDAIKGEVSEEAAEKSVAEDEPLKNNTMSADEIEALLVKSGLSADIPNFDDADDDDDDDDDLSDGGAMSQEDIEKLLNSAQNEPAPAAEPAVEATSGGKMSQEDIEKLLNSAQNEPAPAAEPAVETTSGGKMSQEDIEKLLNSAQNEPAPAAEPAPEAASGGKMSQEDIEKLLNSAQNEPAPAAEPAPEATSGGKMSQEDIEKLLNSAQNEPAPAAEPAVETTSGGAMSQEDIEKLLNSAQNEPAPSAEPAVETTSGGKMSQEDIEALLSGMKEDAAK